MWKRAKVALSVLFDGGHPKDPALARLFGLGHKTASGAEISERNALAVSAVYAAVRLISETIGSLPLAVYSGKYEREKNKAVNHPAYRLLHESPNEEMTAIVFRETMQQHVLLWGNAYAEISWDGLGRPARLWPIEPWRVQPQRNDGKLEYLVDGKPYASRDLLHVPGLGNGVVGVSVIHWARESMGLSVAAEKFGAEFFGNGAVPGGVLQHPGVLGEEAWERLKKDFADRQSNSQNSHGIFIAEEGMKYEKIGIPPDDAQFLETRKFQISEIARWFNVPPHMLRDLERATFSNIEQQSTEFAIYTILPWLIRWEQEYNRKLLAGDKYFAKHNFDGLVRGDMATRTTHLRQMFGIGAYSVNDILEILDRNPVGPDGDKRFIPLNMTTIEKAGEEEPEQSPPPPAEDDDPADTGEMPPKKLDAAHQALIDDTLRRMSRKEVNQALRAAKKPGEFLSWVDDFYSEYPATLKEALEPVLAVCAVALSQESFPVDRIVGRLVDLSREELLEASECQPSELPERISSMLSVKSINLEEYYATAG